jgi:hypothetical protein
MKNQSRTSLKAIILGACLIFTAAAAQPAGAQSIGWMSLGLASSAGPALSDHSDGQLYIAAVNKQGAMFYRSTNSPTGWTAWKPVGSGAPVFAADTAPVFVRDGGVLYLFARGVDSNIYAASKLGTGEWSSWQWFATGGQVAGRFSVAFTRFNSAGNLEIHMIFKAYADTVKYMQFASDRTPTGLTRQWTGAQEGSIGSNGYEALLAVRTANAVVVESVRRLLDFSGFTWVFLAVTTRTAEGAEGHLYELSNIVYLGEAFHMTYTMKYLNTRSTFGGYVHVIEHARFRSGKSDDGYRRQLATWDSSGSPPQPELCVYRNKLVAAYRDHQGYISYARWDNADPAGPWVGREAIAGGLTSHRPVLAVFDRRASGSALDYSTSNFGNDLFAAVNGYGDDALWVANCSREIFRQDLDRQFAIYNSRSNNCDDSTGSRSPIRVSLYSDNRPYLSELGYLLWTTPAWLSNTLFYKEAVRGCSSGNRWFKSPCENARIPIVVQTSDKGIYFCDGDSIWITYSDTYTRIYEELGHITAWAMGLDIPTQSLVSSSDISLAALQEANRIFEIDATYMNGKGRFVGFTDRRYETVESPSRQHHFIYPMIDYFSDGAKLRQWVQEDLSVGSDLLKRKYDWIRQYIFRGVEFKKDNEPLASRPPCTYSLSSTSRSFGGGGGASSVSLLTQEGCNWTAKSNASWISITSSLSGSGSARINFSVTQNTTSADRTGTMTIAGQTVTVTQYRFVCVKCLPGSP